MKKIIAVVIMTIALVACATMVSSESDPKVEIINFDEPLIIDVPIYKYAFEPLEIEISKKA